MDVGTVQGMPITYTAELSGAAEDPSNASPGTGFATVIFDDIAHTLSVDVSFSGLIGITTAAHIHCCTSAPETGTASVATATPSFPGFPAGVTSGSYTNLFDLTLSSSFNPFFITANGNTPGAEAALGAGLAGGLAYFNIHTQTFTGGEIRGFLRPVPEPDTFSLLSLGIVSLLVAKLKRRDGQAAAQNC